MKHLNAIQKIPGVGPQKTKILLNYFGAPENVWKADFAELAASKVGEKTAQRIILERSGINPDEEWEKRGYVNNVVFPTGAALFDDDLYIYYGAADSRIGVASMKLSELLQELKNNKTL